MFMGSVLVSRPVWVSNVPNLSAPSPVVLPPHTPQLYYGGAAGGWRLGLAGLQAILPQLSRAALTHLAPCPELGAWLPGPLMKLLAEALWAGRELLPDVMERPVLRALLATAAAWAAAAGDAGRSEGARVAAVGAVLDAREAAALREAVAADHVMRRCTAREWARGAGSTGGTSGGGPPETVQWASDLRAALAVHLTGAVQLGTSTSAANTNNSAGSGSEAAATPVARLSQAVTLACRLHGHSHPHSLGLMAMHAAALAASAPLPAEDAGAAAGVLRALDEEEEEAAKLAAAQQVAPAPGRRMPHTQPGLAYEAERVALRVLELAGLATAALAQRAAQSGAQQHTQHGHAGVVVMGAGGLTVVEEEEAAGLLRAAADAHAVLGGLREVQGCHEAAANHFRLAAEAR